MMPFVAPTVEDFRARYPEFAAAGSPLVQAVLDEVTPEIGGNWIEADRRPAILAFTAHLLTEQGLLNQVVEVGETSVVAAGALKRVKVGDVETEFSGSSSSSSGSARASVSPLASTPYGRRYLELLRRSHPPVLVI